MNLSQRIVNSATIPWWLSPARAVRFILAMLWLVGMLAAPFFSAPVAVVHAAPLKTGVPGAYSICVRPGGTSRPWSFGTDSTPDPVYPGIYTITQISYHNVTAFGWILTRGSFQYSTNGGTSWNNYTVSSLPNYVSVAGKQWRFIDTAGSDKTTSNSIGVGWYLQGPPTPVGGGTTIIPDNPPTNITSSTSDILTNTPAGTTVATLTPTDTGCTVDGLWEIDSQSVSNLFTIAYDATTGNLASLKIGTGTLPADGQTATVTVHYYDMYQTNASGVKIAGQGFSKLLTFTFRADATQDLSFSNDAAAKAFTPVYPGYDKPAAATLTTTNYVVAWTEFGHGADAKASNGTANDFGGIYARLYNPIGTPAAAAFAVTPEGDGVDTYEVDVAALNAGRYVVTYRTSTASNGYDIAYRVIEANGSVGSELKANTTLSGDQVSPAIATLSDGSFIITWNSAGSIRAQKFNALDGSKNGAELTLHTNTSDINPGVGALANGDYAMAWGDSNTGNISLVLGSAPGTVIPLVTDGSAWGLMWGEVAKVVGLTGGGFVVTWDSYANDLINYAFMDVFFQRFNSAGVPQGGAVQANPTSGGFKGNPALAALTGGGFVVGWQADSGDYDPNGIFGRRFTATGAAVDAGNFEINQYRKGDQSVPELTALGSNLFAAAWETAPSPFYPTNPGIFTRVLLPQTCLGVGSGTVNWTVAFGSCPLGAKLIIPVGLNVVLDVNINLDVDLEVLGTLDATSQMKTMTLTGSAAQTLTGNPLTFYRLTLNKTNKTDTVNIVGKLKVTQKLTLTRGKLLSASDYLDIEIQDEGELSLSNDISVGGNFTKSVNGTFTANNHTTTFDGTGDQLVNLASYTDFENLVVAATAVLVEVDPSNSLFATNSLVNNGVIRKTQTIPTTGFYDFGLAGDYGGGFLALDVVADSFTSIQVERRDHDHTAKTGTTAASGVGWGRYWTITPTGSGTVNLTLPSSLADNSQGKVCRYTGTAKVWDCALDAFDATSVTRNGVSTFSDWAVGNHVTVTQLKLVALRGESGSAMPVPALMAAALLALALIGLGVCKFR